MTTICLIPGDGVGREVVPAAAQAVATLLPDVRFVTAQAGWDCFVRCGNALPDETLRIVQAADATLFGATQSPTTGAGSAVEALNGGKPAVYRSPILGLRKKLDLFANLRPAAPLVPNGQRRSTCSSSVRTPKACTAAASAATGTRRSPSA